MAGCPDAVGLHGHQHIVLARHPPTRTPPTPPGAEEPPRRETAYMRSVGMTKEVLSAKEVADLVPLMRTDDVVRGFWTPDEGRANPVDVTMSLAKGARQRGARIFEETEVTGFTIVE